MQVFIFAVYLENNLWGTMVMMPHPSFPGVPSSGILGIIFLVIFIISYFNSPTVMSSGADNSNNSSNPDTSTGLHLGICNLGGSAPLEIENRGTLG